MENVIYFRQSAISINKLALYTIQELYIVTCECCIFKVKYSLIKNFKFVVSEFPMKKINHYHDPNGKS